MMETHVANQENSQRLYELMPELKTEFYWCGDPAISGGEACVRIPRDEYDYICPAPLADELAAIFMVIRSEFIAALIDGAIK